MTSSRARMDGRRHPRRVAWALVLAYLIPGGCRSVDPTEILLKVDSNLYPAPVDARLSAAVEPLSYDTIVVTVLNLVPDPPSGTPLPWQPGDVNAHVGQLVDLGDGFTYAVRLTEQFAYPFPPLPIEIGIVPRGGDPSRVIFMQAAALRHGRVVTHSEARTSFAAHRITSFRILLSKECLPVDCAPGRTCRDGRCERVGVDPACLPPAGVDAGPASTHECVDGGPAGPQDAGPQDAGPIDGPPYLPCGKTFTSSGFDSYIRSMSGGVSYVPFTHDDGSTLPDGGSCSGGCTETVLKLADGASVSGIFAGKTEFQLSAAKSNDSGTLHLVVCGDSFSSGRHTTTAPNFTTVPQGAILDGGGVGYYLRPPGGQTCTYTISASAGVVYIRRFGTMCL